MNFLDQIVDQLVARLWVKIHVAEKWIVSLSAPLTHLEFGQQLTTCVLVCET
jgi:hypothetical protein